MVVGILQQILKISNVCIMMVKQNEKSKIVQNKPHKSLIFHKHTSRTEISAFLNKV